MTTVWIAPRKAARFARRSSAGDDPARLAASHPWLMATAGQRRDANSARPAVLQCPTVCGRPPNPDPPNHTRCAQIPIEPAAPPAPL
jgi:hypothetical protein